MIYLKDKSNVYLSPCSPPTLFPHLINPSSFSFTQNDKKKITLLFNFLNKKESLLFQLKHMNLEAEKIVCSLHYFLLYFL